MPPFLKVRLREYKVSERNKIKACLWQKKFIGKGASGSDYHIYRTGIYPHALCKNVIEK